MPISHQYKIIFIHIPKTAGTPIEYALGMHGDRHSVGVKPYIDQTWDEKFFFGNGLQHLRAIEIRRRIGKEKFDTYYKFSVIRNPYERLVSNFAWIGGKWARQEYLTKKEFKQRVLEIDKTNYMKRKHLAPQYLFLFDENNTLLVDDIIRYESFSEGIKKIENKINIDMALERRMASYHYDYVSYYDSELIEIVNELYDLDFKLLSYEKK